MQNKVYEVCKVCRQFLFIKVVINRTEHLTVNQIFLLNCICSWTNYIIPKIQDIVSTKVSDCNVQLSQLNSQLKIFCTEAIQVTIF